jgi:hypothetical protein
MTGLCTLLLLITCGSRSGGGVKLLLAPSFFSLILPLHFRPCFALSLKGLVVEKLASPARISAVDVLTVTGNNPNGPLLGEGGA